MLEGEANRSRRFASPFTRVDEATPLQQALAQAAAAGECPALILLDMDDFGRVNERHGVGIGDWALHMVKLRLAAAAMQGVLGRTGDDEFAVLLRGCPSPRQASDFAAGLLAAVRAPMAVAKVDLSLSASAGIALRAGASPAELLTLARQAMLEGKEHGPGGVRFAPRAERAGQDLHYGLLVGTMSRRIVGIEVADPRHLAKACAQVVAFERQGLGMLRLAVPAGDDAICHRATAALEACGLAPSRLEVILTKQQLQDPGAIAELRSLGVHSSVRCRDLRAEHVAALGAASLTLVRVDGSLAPGQQETDRASLAALAGALAVAKEFGLGVLAENVRCTSQLEYLAARGCEVAGGYPDQTPRSAKELGELLRAGSLPPAGPALRPESPAAAALPPRMPPKVMAPRPLAPAVPRSEVVVSQPPLGRGVQADPAPADLEAPPPQPLADPGAAADRALASAGVIARFGVDVRTAQTPQRPRARMVLTRVDRWLLAVMQLAGAGVGLAVVLPVHKPSAVACPPAGEGLVSCQIQKAWAPAAIEVAAFIVAFSLVYLTAARLVQLHADWRSGKLAERRRRERARSLPSAEENPLLAAAAWGVTQEKAQS